jgi:hypothetical protein
LLQPSLGGARIELSVRGRANRAQPATNLMLSATLLIGRTTHDLRELAPVTVQWIVRTAVQPTNITFVGHVSTQALLELEELRQGGELWLAVRDVRATSIDGEPLGLAQGTDSGSLMIHVLSEEWSIQLEKVLNASYVDILIAVTDDPELQKATDRIKKARTYIRRGTFDPVAAELRQALDAVRVAYNTGALLKAARAKDKPRERNVQERWAVEVEDLYSLLSVFIHDDEEAIADAKLDRPLAMEFLGNVAGKLHRLAAERHAGLI